MLFNSFSFIFIFLPGSLIVFYLSSKYSLKLAFLLLTAASICFYAFSTPGYAILLICSILFDFFMAEKIYAQQNLRLRKTLLIISLSIDLLLLFFFKYLDFFVTIVNKITHSHFHEFHIELPPGISFYTFVQIAYLVDAYRRIGRERSLLGYYVFITFFPHLIAGPIIHVNEMMPQFLQRKKFFFEMRFISIGISVFIIGLMKKVLFADHFAELANPVFNTVNSNTPVTSFDAWIGMLSYTYQIYFDFSGYSDMAVGLAYMFGIKFPENFNSPYRSTNIIEFWRRWHITLSRFLKDYVYISLGGNKQGELKRYRNLILTMLIGGLWHGARWNFVIWGALHGIALALNHFYSKTKKTSHIKPFFLLSNLIGFIFTFLFVNLAWIYFRTDHLRAASQLFTNLLGYEQASTRLLSSFPYLLLSIAFVLILFFPNTQQIMKNHSPYLSENKKPSMTWSWHQLLVWKPHRFSAILLGISLTFCIFSLTRPSDFIYFRF